MKAKEYSEFFEYVKKRLQMTERSTAIWLLLHPYCEDLMKKEFLIRSQKLCGMTTTSLFKEKKKAGFRLSYRFDVPSIYFKGVYYFPQDIKEYKCRDGTIKKGIQVVYHNGKWRQDTMYKTDRFLNDLVEYAKQKNII